ncbi:MAG: Gfo/Idh/MocA family oxidoreductase [Anaerolineales bacterium]|nr:Gfo/Idh/MocA family oxidoreductase [Anaerolineales bacterium]MCS7247462.1 Gfo/Idh/MocA family oxidoreductase [Anaerolineales bacterium]MDW8161273.1 Gfo/Idh/MocA family oxidoreductase [Anaerolineales bacterium]MDW8447075.1 Gfo/Idh/MocA family oxidoreductase [Anaerolineales bacterium]
MREITFAVIGSGFMGSLLSRAASELPYTRFVAASDLEVERAKRLATRYGGQAYGSYEEMLSNHRPDAVLIATPEFDHLAPSLCAANAGCHIFLEKPIATTLQDAVQIIEASNRAGIKLMLGHILRFEASYALIHSAIREGSIGKLLSMYARRITSINEAKRLNGRVTPLTYIGVHDIDQMLWYHPVPAKSVYARALYGRVSELLGTYDSAWVMIEFEDGALGIHEVGWCLPESWARWSKPSSWGGFGDVRMNVIGTHGNLSLDFTPMNLFGVGMEGWMLPDTRHWPLVHDRLAGAVKLEVEHFFSCISEDKQPLVRGEDGLRVLEIVLAAEKSIVDHSIVEIELFKA